jgi:glycosyltransferase involved in cell wall biosynthesis
MAAAMMTGTKLVEHVHDARYLDPGDLATRQCLTAQIRYAKYLRGVSDRVVVLSEHYRRRLLQNGSGNHRVRKILNGIPVNGAVKVDEEAAARLRRELGLAEKDQVILTSGRMSAEKNMNLIFRIAPLVTRAVPNAVFLLSGNGPRFDEFKAKSRELKDCRIELIGYYPEILDLLAISQVFLLPSLQELHSIAILEALSMKVPVITSGNVGCNDEFITSWHNGVLLNPFCDAGWAEAVIQLLREPDLRKHIGQRGYETCLNRFDIRKVAREFEDLYCEILGK